MTNADKFTDLYNKLDKLIRSKGNITNDRIPYFEVLESSKITLVKNNLSEFKQFGKLRNAIVHNPRSQTDNKVIAEPHEFIVQRIEHFYNKILNPIRVTPKFNREVATAILGHNLNKVLDIMRVHSYSQIPIIDNSNKEIELVNTNTIARWLSHNFEQDGTVLAENIKMQDLISHIEFPKNFKFISSSTLVDDAIEIFSKHQQAEGCSLDALIITSDGKDSGNIVGIVTIQDIAEYR